MLGIEQASLLHKTPTLLLDPRPEVGIQVREISRRPLVHELRPFVGGQLFELFGGEDRLVGHDPRLPSPRDIGLG